MNRILIKTLTTLGSLDKIVQPVKTILQTVRKIVKGAASANFESAESTSKFSAKVNTATETASRAVTKARTTAEEFTDKAADITKKIAEVAEEATETISGEADSTQTDDTTKESKKENSVEGTIVSLIKFIDTVGDLLEVIVVTSSAVSKVAISLAAVI